MKPVRIFPLAAIAACCFAFTSPSARAQVPYGVQAGSPPDCPYGYFDYAPYNCAPFGYYGPQWFQDGAFIGAGPWYRGSNDFDGMVNRHYDPRYGYEGPLPRRGERADWDSHRGWEEHYRGDDRRHEVRQENDGGYGQEQQRRGDDNAQQRNRHDDDNRNGQYQNRRDNGGYYGQGQDRRDNGGYTQEQQRRDDNAQQQRRHDDDNRNGQYQQRDNRDQNNGGENGGTNGRRHHDDDGH